jgi:hypothetical protein
MEVSSGSFHFKVTGTVHERSHLVPIGTTHWHHLYPMQELARDWMPSRLGISAVARQLEWKPLTINVYAGTRGHTGAAHKPLKPIIIAGRDERGDLRAVELLRRRKRHQIQVKSIADRCGR